MKIIRSLMWISLIILNLNLFAQNEKSNEKINKATIQNPWESIFNKHKNGFWNKPTVSKPKKVKIDSFNVNVFFDNDSSRLFAESKVYTKDRDTAIRYADKFMKQEVLKKLRQINPEWAAIDTTAILFFIENRKMPIIKRIKYRPKQFVLANYKIALNMNGEAGLRKFLNDQLSVIAGRAKGKRFTGLVIDARKFYVRAVPLINVICGNSLVFGPKVVDRNVILERGMILWSRQIANDDVCARVGKNPLIVTPIRILNGNTFMLDAKFLRELRESYFQNLLKNAAVVIVN